MKRSKIYYILLTLVLIISALGVSFAAHPYTASTDTIYTESARIN